MTEKKEVLVPMRDGAQLALDLYFPSGPSNGTCPWCWSERLTIKRFLARRQSFGLREAMFMPFKMCGTLPLRGRFETWVREGPDGFDTIEWLARQPWCSGKVGTIGPSYNAVVQWQAAVERPPHGRHGRECLACRPSPLRPGRSEFHGVHQWLYIIRGQKPEDSSPLTALESFPPPAFEKALGDLPVAGQDLKVFGRVDEIWRRWCSEGPDSDYWKPIRYLSKVDRVTVPVLHQSGWFDGDGLGTKLNYLAMMKTERRTSA